MALFLILALVVALYIRTITYNYVIDDSVKRGGYMYEVPLTAPHSSFYFTRPSKMYRLFMIGMHCVNVSVIYLLWGWAPALLFAVHPLGVWGTAWVTGNYYATAAYFTLIAYYILHTFPNAIGALVAMPIYAAAINSTICPITFPFIFLFTSTPWGLAMFFPLAMFLRGRRFKTGIKIRYNINNDKVFRDGTVKFSYVRRLALMTKVVARYIYPCLVPNQLGFFSGYGKGIKETPERYNYYHSFNHEFWAALALCLSLFVGGLMISPIGTLWFFAFAALHSQFNLTGQFYAQRYLYLSSIGICVIVGTLFSSHPIVIACMATFLITRTHMFIPAWKNMESMWRNECDTYPLNPQSWNNMAQYYFALEQPIPAWRVNEIGYFLFKAEQMAPDSWEVHMNLACFFAKIGQIHEVLLRTNKAIELLEPLGGQATPLEVLKSQRLQLIQQIEEQNKKLKQGSAQTSLPQKEGVNNDKRTSDSKEERIFEPSRSPELAGREAGA